MRRIAPLVLLLLAVLFFCLPAFVSFALPAWGPRGCPPVGGFAVGQARSHYEWKPNAINASQVDLYRDGRPVGAWFTGEGKYYSSLGRDWREEPVPTDVPAEARELVQNFGLDLDHVDKRSGVFLHTRDGARQVTREEAGDILQNGLVDDRDKLQLTLISADKTRREAFLREAVGAGLGDVVTRAVPPDYVGLKDSETGKLLFEISGDTIYLQEPDGKVLARLAEAKPGEVKTLASVVEGIRKPKPYDPAKDPDPRKPRLPEPTPEPPKPDGVPDWPRILATVPPQGWVLLGLALLGGVAFVGRKTAPR